MNIDEILDVMDEFLEKSWSVPLSGGKCMVDIEKLRQMIDDIRLNLPSEIKQAKMIASDRKDIITNARKEADDIIKKAENRARILIDENEITIIAKKQANDMVAMAQQKSTEMKKAAMEYSDNVMKITEDCLMENLKNVKQAKEVVRKSRKTGITIAEDK
ncbi:MAG: hypothetical protein RR447_02790 [Algoriella sp.]